MMMSTTVGMLPNFCIIGAMRSGTTSLARYLGAHPEIFMAPQKEVRYFDQQYALGPEWYRSQFRGVTSETAVGEATPYMHHATAMERMAEAVPDLRLIAILRNPVDRAYSHYWMRRERGQERLGFGDVVWRGLDASDDDPAARYLRWSDYLPQLERVRSVFSRERLHVVIFEELRATAHTAYGDICRFLGVSDSFVPQNLGSTVNAYVRFRSVSLRRIARRLPDPAGRVVGRLNSIASSYPPMDPQLRLKLLRHFEPANEHLSEWLQRDLSVWTA
jgi:hypothetical protein